MGDGYEVVGVEVKVVVEAFSRFGGARLGRSFRTASGRARFCLDLICLLPLTTMAVSYLLELPCSYTVGLSDIKCSALQPLRTRLRLSLIVTATGAA